MGVNIAEVDTVIISHGHVDHGGGLKYLLENNNKALIYIKKTAFNTHITKVLGLKVNIGINKDYKNHPQLIFTDNLTEIDENIILFSGIEKRKYFSESNNKLYKIEDSVFTLDDFNHEQHLIIRENNKYNLLSGCSHMGIVNIVEHGQKIIGKDFENVIGGFHLYNPISRKKENSKLVKNIGKELLKTKTNYYTCHCTGEVAFNKLKAILGNRLKYLSTGTVIEI